MEEWEMGWEEREKLQAEIEHFGRRLADMYFRSAADVDKFIVRYSHEWAMDRMPGIDRNLLRLALTELRFFPDVPVSAAICGLPPPSSATLRIALRVPVAVGNSAIAPRTDERHFMSFSFWRGICRGDSTTDIYVTRRGC
jgi:hypothetical protein